MPRFFSSSIQSEVAARWFLRAVTDPANCTAPPYSRNFSVSVVLPASGCEMMANVRRRAISSVKGHRCQFNRDSRSGRRDPEEVATAGRGQVFTTRL